MTWSSVDLVIEVCCYKVQGTSTDTREEERKSTLQLGEALTSKMTYMVAEMLHWMLIPRYPGSSASTYKAQGNTREGRSSKREDIWKKATG